MEYIFFGNHSSLPGRLERALNRRVVECPTLTQFCQARVHVDPVNFCIFLEKDDVREDLETIQKLRKLYSTAYIILFANFLDKEEKIAYIKVGVNCVITESITKEELLRLLAIAEDFLSKKQSVTRKTKSRTDYTLSTSLFGNGLLISPHPWGPYYAYLPFSP